MVQITREERAQRLRTAERRQAILQAVFETLPRLMEASRNMDAAVKKAIPLKRGERGKRAGGVLSEEVTVESIKLLKKQFMQDGYSGLDAGEKARKVLALVTGTKPTTLEDWEKGKSRREREKPIECRSFRRRKKQKQGTD